MQEILQLFVIETFLERLTRSPESANFVLKGGALLAAYGGRRPTRDVDFQAVALPVDNDAVLTRLVNISLLPSDDGSIFDGTSATATSIRHDDPYQGIRVNIRGRLATARIDLRIDVGVADPITPPPTFVTLPRLFGGALQLLAYPVDMIIAEKIVTAATRGTANTRWRDFWDVVELSRRHRFDSQTLNRSVRSVIRFRRVAVTSLADVLAGYDSLGQPGWAAWRRRNGLETSTPSNFGAVLEEFIAFADPVMREEELPHSWDPHVRRWLSDPDAST